MPFKAEVYLQHDVEEAASYGRACTSPSQNLPHPGCTVQPARVSLLHVCSEQEASVSHKHLHCLPHVISRQLSQSSRKQAAPGASCTDLYIQQSPIPCIKLMQGPSLQM